MTKPGARVKICLIFNPAAKGGKARHLRQHLDSLGASCELRPTRGPGGARPLAAQAVREGFQTLIAAGGDGTVNEVLNGIGDVPGGFESARLAVFPLGTVNVFARELGIPMKFDAAWKIIQRGHEKRIDLPKAQFSVNGKPESRYFIQLAGAGLDSRAIELVNWKLKTQIGPLAYVVAGFKAMNERHPLITIEGGGSASGELVIFGNGRFYGGPFPFFPQARLDDGLVDACVYPKITWPGAIRMGLGLPSRRPHAFQQPVLLQAPTFKLSASQRVILELDGENAGDLPVKIAVQPRALRVIC